MLIKMRSFIDKPAPRRNGAGRTRIHCYDTGVLGRFNHGDMHLAGTGTVEFRKEDFFPSP
jgi:hypothetical protein